MQVSSAPSSPTINLYKRSPKGSPIPAVRWSLTHLPRKLSTASDGDIVVQEMTSEELPTVKPEKDEIVSTHL